MNCGHRNQELCALAAQVRNPHAPCRVAARTRSKPDDHNQFPDVCNSLCGASSSREKKRRTHITINNTGSDFIRANQTARLVSQYLSHYLYSGEGIHLSVSLQQMC